MSRLVNLGKGATMPLVRFIAKVREGQIPIINPEGVYVGWTQKNEPVYQALRRLDLNLTSAGEMKHFVLDDRTFMRAEFEAYVLTP